MPTNIQRRINKATGMTRRTSGAATKNARNARNAFSVNLMAEMVVKHEQFVV